MVKYKGKPIRHVSRRIGSSPDSIPLLRNWSVIVPGHEVIDIHEDKDGAIIFTLRTTVEPARKETGV